MRNILFLIILTSTTIPLASAHDGDLGICEKDGNCNYRQFVKFIYPLSLNLTDMSIGERPFKISIYDFLDEGLENIYYNLKITRHGDVISNRNIFSQNNTTIINYVNFTSPGFYLVNTTVIAHEEPIELLEKPLIFEDLLVIPQEFIFYIDFDSFQNDVSEDIWADGITEEDCIRLPFIC